MKQQMIIKNRNSIIVALALLAGLGVLLLGRTPEAAVGANECRLDGAWIVRYGDALLYQTFQMDPSGSTGIVSIDPIIASEPTLGGLFPDAQNPGTGARGNIWRISQNSWGFFIISHGRRIATAGSLGEVINIATFEGVATLTDCDTEAAIIERYRLYTADADADGDGFPDEGAEPVIELQGIEGSAKRI